MLSSWVDCGGVLTSELLSPCCKITTDFNCELLLYLWTLSIHRWSVWYRGSYSDGKLKEPVKPCAGNAGTHSNLVYFLFTTFAHTMTKLPIINKLKFFSYQRPTAYRYGSGPERTGGMLFKLTKELPACHTGPYRLTSSPAEGIVYSFLVWKFCIDVLKCALGLILTLGLGCSFGLQRSS